jgi:hypothetical protein
MSAYLCGSNSAKPTPEGLRRQAKQQNTMRTVTKVIGIYQVSELPISVQCIAEQFCYISKSGKAMLEDTHDLLECFGISIKPNENGLRVVTLTNDARKVAKALIDEDDFLDDDFSAPAQFLNGEISEVDFLSAITGFAFDFTNPENHFEFYENGQVVDNGSVYLDKYDVKNTVTLDV